MNARCRFASDDPIGGKAVSRPAARRAARWTWALERQHMTFTCVTIDAQQHRRATRVSQQRAHTKRVTPFVPVLRPPTSPRHRHHGQRWRWWSLQVSFVSTQPKRRSTWYSYSLTVFSPSGKLVQIEHALAAVSSGTTSLGIKGALLT